MKHRRATGYRLAAMLMPATATVILCVSLWQLSAFSRHNSIRQLETLPVNTAVHLVGAVIHTDKSKRELWIQDDSGAIPIYAGISGAKLRLGEAISVEGRVERWPAAKAAATTAAPAGHHLLRNRELRSHRRGVAGTGKEQEGAGASASVAGGTADGKERIALENAAPTVTVVVTRIEALYAGWTLLALPTAIFVPLWLVVLYLRIRRQNKDLMQASETGEAIRELSGQLQRLTREAKFNREIWTTGNAEIAPLAAGVNAMVAEFQKRDGVRRDTELRLGYMALMDNLTGLPNRKLLSERLGQCLERARRDEKLLALLCIDLDDFKQVNDTYGHAIGDALLGQVARRLKAQFRFCDTLARIGGDEFALFLDDLENREEAHAQAEEVQNALKEPFEIGGHRVQTGAHIGISLFPDATESDEMLQQADCAMYAAKRSGRRRIVQFGDDLGIAARERLTLERELQNAIAKREISLDYQPEIDLATNEIVRFEALARWTHPKLGSILPAVFIPLAEESGLIGTIGAYIMERACTDAARWQEAAGRPVQVAVNVSSVQFGSDRFVEEVAEVLERTGLAPHLLQIELTESATVNGMERAAEIMRQLKRMGVSVAVDDFGTGYSCLSYLPKLPFDTLKLDRSFMSEMMVRRETKAFIGSIMTLARNLDMKVIAEGIETPEQLRAIRAMGSDGGQGFLLGRPCGDPIALLTAPQVV